jgi:hypothetical protein
MAAMGQLYFWRVEGLHSFIRQLFAQEVFFAHQKGWCPKYFEMLEELWPDQITGTMALRDGLRGLVLAFISAVGQ